jgi:hypothetical protein
MQLSWVAGSAHRHSTPRGPRESSKQMSPLAGTHASPTRISGNVPSSGKSCIKTAADVAELSAWVLGVCTPCTTHGVDIASQAMHQVRYAAGLHGRHAAGKAYIFGTGTYQRQKMLRWPVAEASTCSVGVASSANTPTIVRSIRFVLNAILQAMFDHMDTLQLSMQ